MRALLVALLSVGCGGSGPVLLGSGAPAGFGISVDQSNVFWLSGSACSTCGSNLAGLLAAPKWGGLTTDLFDPKNGSVAFAIDDDFVYLREVPTSVLRVPKGGGVAQPLGMATATGSAIDVDDTYIYFSTGPDIFRAPKDGSAPAQMIATNPLNPGNLRVDDTNVYFTDVDDEKVSSVPKQGGIPAVIASARAFSGGRLAIDTDNVYFISCVALACSPAELDVVPKSGATPQKLADLTTASMSFAVGPSRLFLVNGASQSEIDVVPKTGGALTTIATDANPISAIAIDGNESNVYWLDATGDVYRKSIE